MKETQIDAQVTAKLSLEIQTFSGEASFKQRNISRSYSDYGLMVTRFPVRSVIYVVRTELAAQYFLPTHDTNSEGAEIRPYLDNHLCSYADILIHATKNHLKNDAHYKTKND